MIKVILSHEVKDFAQWKEHFEAGKPKRDEVGVKITGVYTELNKPNRVTVTSQFPSPDGAQEFLSNPDLKADMEKGGVIGQPEVKILLEA